MIEHPQEQFLNLTKLADRIIAVSNVIRRVLVIDEQGNEVYTKATEKAIIKEEHIQAFAKDIHFFKGLLKLYDDMIGESTFTLLTKTKGHMLIFHYTNWIFVVSCEREKTRCEIADISDRIEKIIKNQLDK